MLRRPFLKGGRSVDESRSPIKRTVNGLSIPAAGSRDRAWHDALPHPFIKGVDGLAPAILGGLLLREAAGEEAYWQTGHGSTSA